MAEINFAEEKSIIGYLLKYYRKENDMTVESALYNVGAYYKEFCLDCNKCTNKEIITSLKTYRKIENGEVVKNECIYHRLAENFEMKVLFERKVFQKIVDYRDELYCHLTDYSYTNLKRLRNEIEKDLKLYHNVILIQEMLQFYYDILVFEIDRKVADDKNIRLYFYLKDIVKDKDNKLINYYFYQIIHYHDKVYEQKEEIFKFIENYSDEPLFFSMKLILLCENDLLNAYIELNKIPLEKEIQFTDYQRFCLYDTKAFVAQNIGKSEESYQNLNRCVELINDGLDISEKSIGNCYKRIGKVLCDLKRYEEGVDYFLKAMQFNCNMGVMYVLFFHALEKIGNIETLKAILEAKKNIKSNNILERKILNYYRNKYASSELSKTQIAFLEDYICEELTPSVVSTGGVIMSIFKNELLHWVSITTNYKKVFMFENKVKNIKD